MENIMKNRLKDETSPYLLQHATNPVNWYPWGEEAFDKAKKEDKPVFLSIGYSTCHWCHVMAHESFEDREIAEILNQNFISIKVDKEERPDIDSIYMAVCQAFTGSGGWPTSIFLTPEQKPFFAGTYFPKTARYGQIGFRELLLLVKEKWQKDRITLLASAEEVTLALKQQKTAGVWEADMVLVDKAVKIYKQIYDKRFGGFGSAPKFPTPHNLLFLLKYYEKSKDAMVLDMVEKTLQQMYRGGIFDHIGGGFSRYSTDDYFLVPHFEKMLYDNALLIMAYCMTYQVTKKELYRRVAEGTAEYVLRKLTAKEGGFFCAEDADSEGVEGKYYLFEPEEIIAVLGEEAGKNFNMQFHITIEGNFEGKNIPNLLKNNAWESVELEEEKQMLYAYRSRRYELHLDDKILTSWNGLMIAAMCILYRVTGNHRYLAAAQLAQKFVETKLYKEDRLCVSYREGKCNGRGFLDDYAFEIFAMLSLYEATLEKDYLEKAKDFCERAVTAFWDEAEGGFFLYGRENEQLIFCPKETYEGAVFSGNSAMAYNLVRLHLLYENEEYKILAQKQMDYLSAEAKNYPAGHAMFLVALMDYLEMPEKVTIVVKDKKDIEEVSCQIPVGTIIKIWHQPTEKYPLLNGRTTFYECKGNSCKAPVNELTKN